LTIDALAAAHFMSRRRLYQLFDDVGESPAEWIRSRRLQHAALLLRREGDASMGVSDISERSGFADATTFSRAFRRKYGVNPSDFRDPANIPATPPGGARV
jgi:AraC family transcriptional regulator, positive regulator of tynA and feaB